MGVRKTLKKGFFSGLNVKRWVGFGQITDNASTIKDIAKSALAPGAAYADGKKKETFDQALVRLKMSPADLEKRMRVSKQVVMFCLAASAAVLAYFIYLIFKGFYLGGFVTLLLTLLLWAYAIREHFNLFQMRQRRLGCSMQEWMASIFKRS